MVREEYNHSRPVSALIRDWLLYSKASGGGGILKTVTGNPISISDALAARIKSLSVSLSPIQEGSGDPSPDNIRPITGRDSVTVVRTGKNLFNEDDFALADFSLVTDPDDANYGYYFGLARKLGLNASSPFSKDNGGLVKTDQIGGAVTVSLDVSRIDSRMYIRFYYEDGTDSGTNHSIENGFVGHKSVTSNPNKSVSAVCFLTVGGATSKIAIKNVQVERSDTATNYEPYDGTSVTVQLGQTVYGGTAEIISGQGESMMGMADLGGLTWEKFTGAGYADLYYSDSLASAIGATDGYKTHGICSQYTLVDHQGHSGADGTATEQPYNSIRFRAYDGRIYLKVAGYATAAELTAALSGVQLCYELATPQTLTLNPATLSTLRGDNTVWSDGDDISMTYVADPKLYINKVVNA